MAVDVFRFSLSQLVPLDEAEMTLQLATFAVEGLFGTARVRLDFSYHVDAHRHALLLDGTKEVGSVVVRVFAGLLLREFGEEAFQIDRIGEGSHHPQEVAA